MTTFAYILEYTMEQVGLDKKLERLRNYAWGKRTFADEEKKSYDISYNEKKIFEDRFVQLLKFKLQNISEDFLLLALQHDKLLEMYSAIDPTPDLQLFDLVNIDAFLDKVSELYVAVRDGTPFPAKVTSFHARYLAFKLVLQISPKVDNFLNVDHDVSSLCNESVLQDVVYAKNLSNDVSDIKKIRSHFLMYEITEEMILEKNKKFEPVYETLRKLSPENLPDTKILRAEEILNVKEFVNENTNKMIITSDGTTFATYMIVLMVYRWTFDSDDWFEDLYNKCKKEDLTTKQVYDELNSQFNRPGLITLP